MDPYSSGEDLVVKTRKPYTITKQRERWTEEEHSRFLDALKLHGRAWQRIEEHIGTKTAVQIRSHAQKFFTKLQKEANIKGVPITHAIDIEIPPPRPKRKPSNPYPRKISAGAALTPQVGVKNVNIPSPISSSCQSKVTVDLEKEPEEPSDDGKLGNNNEYRGKDNCCSAFTLVKTVPCSSSSPDDASTEKSCTFRQYVQLSKEVSDGQDVTAASQVTVEPKGIQSDCQQPFQDNVPPNIMNSYLPHEKSVYCKRLDELKQSEYLDKLSSADVSQNFPRNVPVHILDGSLGMTAPPTSSCTTTSQHCSSSSSPSAHHSFSSYHPILSQVQNQDDYQSFLHISAMFSSLIVSALSQNPASYAAAGFSATLWPSSANREAAPSLQQARPTTSSPTPPSMAAIAAATVAAATSWWAAHGLLPLCAPPPPPTFHPAAFNCSPETNNVKRPDQDHPPTLGGQQQCSEALHEEQQHSVLKSSPVLSSSESEASEDAKLGLDCAADATAPAAETEKEAADTVELDDANKPKNKNPVDRSSCGSNTASSSDFDAYASEKVVTEGQDEKNGKEDKVGSEELDAAAVTAIDPFSRRFRNTTNINDSWKEVSEEGRVAFRKLFSRQRLPQSFSPPHDVNNKGKGIPIKESAVEKGENGLLLDLDLNGKPCTVTCPQKPEVENNAASLIGETNEDGLLNMGLGHFKLKTRRTGFKPYKRCSVEAKECRDEEKEPKRLRMEGKAST